MSEHLNKRSYSRGEAVYGLGMIGALIYFIHFHSGSVWLVLLAIVKAVFWPAFVVYHLLVHLQV